MKMDMTEFEEKVNNFLKNGFLVEIKTFDKKYIISKYIAYNDFVDLYFGENLNFLGSVNYSDIIDIRKVRLK